MDHKILVLNPGSTSTKIALYENKRQIFSENIEHSSSELLNFADLFDQAGYRAKAINSVLLKHSVVLSELTAIAGRGGILPNMESGGYLVTEALVDALHDDNIFPHASNLGGILAFEIAEQLGIKAYIYDAVTANEFPDIAAVTGMPDVRRSNLCHVLNMKAVSRKVAEKYGKKYEDLCLLLAHLGGGITVAVLKDGKIIDSIGDDAGPFAPERSGSVPLFFVIDMCYSGKYNKREMSVKVRGQGGLKAYFGTSDCREIEKMIADGNQQAKLMYEAMAYQVAKGIGQLAPVVNGNLDYVVLTGGLAYSEMLTKMISERVSFIAPIEIVPGEGEMEALALGVLRIMKGEEDAKEYQPIKKEKRR